MGPKYLLLIDEIVMPNTGADFMRVHMDIVMISSLAALERTQAQWKTLLKRVGLRCRKVYRYNPGTSDAMLEAVVDQ